jgi:hypothetical protein
MGFLLASIYFFSYGESGEFWNCEIQKNKKWLEGKSL